VLGVLMGLKAKGQLPGNLQWLLATGFCGGFSTFSTFSWETFQLLQQGQWLLAGAYTLLSTLCCLGVVWVGQALV
jgi:fluoride exporter